MIYLWLLCGKRAKGGRETSKQARQGAPAIARQEQELGCLQRQGNSDRFRTGFEDRAHTVGWVGVRGRGEDDLRETPMFWPEQVLVLLRKTGKSRGGRIAETPGGSGMWK